MSNFCPKCGKKLKPGAKFCPFCGKKMRAKPSSGRAPLAAGAKKPAPLPTPLPPSPSTPPHGQPVGTQKTGGGKGCMIGCLIAVIVALLILAALIGTGYYFFFMRGREGGSYFTITQKSDKIEECGSSLPCLDQNLKDCASAQGETDLGEFAVAEFEVIGMSYDSCVVDVEIVEIKSLPPQFEKIPSFIRNRMLQSLFMECLVPEEVYTLGVEETGKYIAENMFTICEGTLLNLLKKFGIEEGLQEENFY